jgi:hypothetical protein
MVPGSAWGHSKTPNHALARSASAVSAIGRSARTLRRDGRGWVRTSDLSRVGLRRLLRSAARCCDLPQNRRLRFLATAVCCCLRSPAASTGLPLGGQCRSHPWKWSGQGSMPSTEAITTPGSALPSPRTWNCTTLLRPLTPAGEAWLGPVTRSDAGRAGSGGDSRREPPAPNRRFPRPTRALRRPWPVKRRPRRWSDSCRGQPSARAFSP